jgi:hypothetical protein
MKSFFFSTVLLLLLVSTATVVVCGDHHRRLGDNNADAALLCASADEWDRHPLLCQLAQDLVTKEQSPDALAQELFDFAQANGWIVDFRRNGDGADVDAEQEVSFPSSSSSEEPIMLRSSSSASQRRQERRKTTRTRAVLPSHNRTVAARLPIVLAHGMGDSCYNGGMQHVTQLLSDWLGVYAVCIPTGGSHSDDTNNGFFLVRHIINRGLRKMKTVLLYSHHLCPTTDCSLRTFYCHCLART